ncbi:uncharacterized protein LOC143301638 isoform X3 [Babylonia areolata]|uniref:uncharacterized protein LOC143301638 isoform X3 n=1 Tax=Babylonia areolata TaxID=304850 RepID=UPI003FCFB862
MATGGGGGGAEGGSGRSKAEGVEVWSSAEGIKSLNCELQEHLTRLRSQLEQHRGSVKSAHWQKVLDARAIRQHEQQKAAHALHELRAKHEREKAHELALLRDSLVQRYEGELHKLHRHKEAELTKLRLELDGKEGAIRRLIGESRRTSLRTTVDGHKSRLIEEVGQLRQAKKELEGLLDMARSAERSHGDELRRREESLQAELAQVRRDAQGEVRQLIEQLKSKDKVISQLERELGHPAVPAGSVATTTEVTRTPSSPGQPSGSNKMETPPLSPHSTSVLSGLHQVFQRLHGARMTSFPLGGEEKGAVENFAGLEAEILGLHDRAQALALDRQSLLDKMKDFEVKNKQLVEKNKRFLEKNIELTAQNRSLKDGGHTMRQQNKELHEEAEQARRRQCELARELQRLRSHILQLEAQAQEVEALKKQIADQTSSITLLRQACTDKDRRIELIQHRKKRRRLIRSQEKCQGVKETFYGYDDDDNDTSIDSETSQSSVSVSTISEEDACDELSREELERSHRQMLREHLQLERSHALLQAHTGSSQDPHRELQTRSQLQADLFSAQCRVELLEKEIRSLQTKQRRGSITDSIVDSVDILALLRERDDLLAARHGLQLKLEQVDGECVRLRQELRKAEERAEDLEFRILELEENPPCEGEPVTLHYQDSDLDPHLDSELDLEGREVEGESQQDEVVECITKSVAPTAVECQPSSSAHSSAPEAQGSMEFERLRRELKAALEKQGVRAEAILRDLGGLKDVEQKVNSMERMAMEMQKKVIALQQEKDGLEERLMRGAPLSLNAEVERRQNLELKEEISRLTCTKEESCAENKRLAKQLEESEHLCISLQEQLKEFLEPSGSIHICSPAILGSSPQNKTDLEKAGDGDNRRTVPCSNKYIQTDKVSDTKRRDKNSRSRSRDSERAEIQALTQKVKTLQEQLKKLEAENLELSEKVTRASNDSSSDEDDPSQPSLKHKPKQKVKTLERQLQVLHSENLRLADKLGGYSPATRLDPEEVIERIVELEDYCTDLQDRMRESEGHERQIRDKLRVAEQTINELEISEAQYRDKCDELSHLDKETKKQLHTLQTTGRELREIILDKEILEQALKEKVEFLEKVEAQSSQRIIELESLEKSLREQLESRDSSSGVDPVYRSLQEKLSHAEQDVKSLRERNNELEENEEILRENWRRVADEDANRLRCLEEKVRMLELMNQDLKNKVAEAQDFVVINSGPTQGSLADELSASSRRAQAMPHSDSPVSGGSDEESGDESPRKKVTKLKRQLSLLEEEKNGKIANLQERLANMRENEIKLSETLAEMEMTERELRAKLALYESSEVTVEKMLKYQDKIDELRTSQESLLDQLETMETQEVTLQEQLEETERRLKGKIVTLEVELKNLKQKEHKGNARIRELEKHEEELKEKTKRQEEKENGLYIRISGLMDQLKEHKTKITEQEKKLAEKDERCRKVASLEAKFLQIEGAYREKVTSLEASLAEAQASLAEEEKQRAETQRTLDNLVQSRDTEHTQRVFILEEMFAQREKGLKEKIASLESSVADRDSLVSQHDESMQHKDSRIAELEKELSATESKLSEHSELMQHRESHIAELEKELSATESKLSEHDESMQHKDNRVAELEKELSAKESRLSELVEITSSHQSKECELEQTVNLKDEHISNMEKDLNDRGMKIDILEKDLSEKESCISKLEKEVSNLQKNVVEKESIVTDLQKNLSEKMICISELERDLDQKVSRIAEVEKDMNDSKTLKAHLAEKDDRIDKLENELGEKVSCISKLEQELSRSESQISKLEKDVTEKEVQITKLEKEVDDRVSHVSQVEKDRARRDEDVNKMVTAIREKESRIISLETDICNKTAHVTHLETVLEDRESQIGDLEAQLETKDLDLSTKLEEARQDMINRDSHIAEMEERIILMTSTMSELEKKAAEKDTCISHLEAQLTDKDSVMSEQVTVLHSKLETEQKSAATKLSSVEEELVAVKLQLTQSDAKSEEYSRKLAIAEKKLEEEKASVESLKLHNETLEGEKELLQSELTAKVSELEAELKDKDHDFQTQMSIRESEFHQACSLLDTECESLRSELMEKGKVIEKLESTKNDLLSKIENLKDRERELSDQLSAVELDLNTLYKQKDSDMQDTMLMWEKRLKDTQLEKDTAVEKASSLEADLTSSKKTIQQQLEEMSQLERNLNEAKSEAKTLQDTLSQLQLQEKESSMQREVLVQQETMLKTKVSQVEAQLQAQSRHQEAQQGNVSELLTQKQNLEEDLQKARSDLTDCYTLNAQLQDHRRCLQEEVADLQCLVKELQVNQEQEKEVQNLLKQERSQMMELESEISHLKDEKESALAETSKLQKELDASEETITNLQSDILGLKSQILVERSSRQEADRRIELMSAEATATQERMAQLLKEAEERDGETGKLNKELLSLRQEQQTQQRLGLSIEEKDQELKMLKEREEAHQKREACLQEKVTAMENLMVRHQEDHSQMCQKLHVLEKREMDLLEQITDVEQSVIVPLETENTELKEEVTSLKQQNEALNLQIDKQEELTREDSAELETLRETVNNLQLSRTEAQSKLDSVLQELKHQESENEVLQNKVADLEALNKNLKNDLDNSKTEMNKLSVLQDSESAFMSRIIDLEEREQQLSEELAKYSHTPKVQQDQESQTAEFLSCKQISTDSTDASVNTEDLHETNTVKVPELFARVQELESANQRLSINLEQATAGEADRRQLTDKLHLLEQAEDRLMERVIELEENEVALRTQLDRSRHRANTADKLEEEVSILLQQEDDWKEKVASLTSENLALSEKLDSLQSQFGQEQSKSDNLAHQIESEQRQLQDAQKELKHVQAKLQTVRSEYEEKLSALEESEKKIENQLDSQSQRECDLRKEIQVLREEMEDVCERYKELELENSHLKQEHSKVLTEFKEAESRCRQLAGGVTREPTVQVAQAHTSQSVLPSGASVSSSYMSSPDPQYSTPPPQMCSKLTVQMVPLSQGGAHGSKSSDNKTQTAQLGKDLKKAHSDGSGSSGFPYKRSSVDSSGEHYDSDSSGVHSSSAHSVKVLTLHDALKENAVLKAQLQDLQTHAVPQDTSPAVPHADRSSRKVSGAQQSADTLQLQSEISRLESRVVELEKSLKEAEGAVQEVVTVVRTRSVHTLEQKIETIQQTIHTQSPTWPLHQELLELLTSQADLQKQVSHLMETEHNLRMTLKEVEDELMRARSGAGTTTLGARRLESDRRLSFQSRLSRFGGGISATKAQGEGSRDQVDSSRKTKEQWLERQVADLQLAKSNLERRLHEAERRLAFRPRSTSASRDELLFRIEQLQEEQGEWRKKVEDLQALNSHYLKEKLELASEKDSLEHRLQTQSPGASSKEVSLLFAGGRREEPVGSSGSVSEAEPSTYQDPDSDSTMRDRPEDVLQKRIKELENLESYLRQQLSEVESDREQLHEITRKDKATIHEQNVRIRELMLQERNLRSQVSSLEDSERSLYNRCSELEDSISRMEDRVHELEVHERRLKELVRKLKLDEEVWLSKSGDLTASMEQLSSSEVSLRKLVQDLQIEKGGLSDRVEYLEVRVKELESLETTLVQRLKNYENVEASLQSRLQHTENSEAAAHSKASELDVINMDLSARLQRAVEENAVLSQHVAQQQGQIHEMDRKLSAATDAQVSLSQHVDSLQKSEGLLQKKVREYELRDIDAQARVRELEQTEEIMKDKINQLQRNENRLKSRLVEFETVGSQVLENMPPAQKQQLPQQLEECQKRVVVLQRQLEAAQAEVHQSRRAEEDATSVKVPTAAWTEMRGKVALLEDAEYQMSELEKLNARLSENILQLRQGKGSCGHEVELEVLKRRLHSYQNTVQKLKHHLSEGQVPSLRAADEGQGPESENLPARDLQSLESERVLQSVRSLTQPPTGLPHTQDHLVQAHSGALQAGRAQGVASAASVPEESHWRTVELRCQAQQEGELRGASPSMPHASATTTSALPHQEELMIGLSLPSESERGSFKSQNDTDSERSGISHPHLRMVGSTTHRGFPPTPGVVPAPRGGGKQEAPPPPMPTTTRPPTSTTSPFAHQQHSINSGFVTDDSFYLPSSAQSESESQEEGEAPPLPSTAPPGAVTLLSPPSLPQPTPSSSADKTFVSAASLPSAGQKGGEGVKGGEGGSTGQKGRAQTMPLQPSLQTTSVVGLSIRQRIAQIERQLKEDPSSKAGSKAEGDDVFTWKAKATENARLLGAAEREGKQLKEDINKLEKDLEEKRRYIYIFEKWILEAEEVLKNKNKKNDRDLVQQLQTEVKHLKQDLGNAGYRKDDIFTDPAALKTELDRKDRELTAKRLEIDSMAEEMQRWRQEASSVESMRKNALDALRLLETEVTQLQDADIQLKQMKDEYNTLRGQMDKLREVYEENLNLHERLAELQLRLDRLREARRDLDNMCARYDEVNIQKNKAVTAVHALRAKVARLAKKCQEKDEVLRRLSEEVRGGRGRSSSLLEELSHLETLAGGEEYNRPLSPLDLITGPATTDTERLMSERIPDTTFTKWSSSSLDDLHDLSAGADKSSLHRPKSAEQVRRGQHGGLPAKQPAGSGGTFGFGGDTVCVAILDYVPDTASRSGHRHLELPLKEGDQVHVRGPVDRHGYCEAEVGGRTGLVPASHLYPLTDSAASYRPISQKLGRHKQKAGGDSVEQIVQLFDDLQDPRLMAGLSQPPSSQKPQHLRHSTATQTRQRQSVHKSNTGPEPPSGLHIKEVDRNSLVLAWQPPVLDQHGCSNGFKVVGYRIYLNGRVCQQPHNPKLSHTRVEGVRNDRPQQLAIQTLAASGQGSSRVELVYQGSTCQGHNHRDQDGESTDLSSILNSIHYKTGKKRTVMGLYDYDPEKQSPGDYTTCELAFSAGDLMLVYGEERQDGFFHGERNGKRGLVPACFVEPVVQGSKSTQSQKPGASSSTGSPRS